MAPKRKFPYFQAPRKRPRGDAPIPPSALSDPSSLPPRSIELVHTTIHSTLKMGHKHVYRALKKARDFETRKLVRRIKAARAKGDDATVARSEEELAAAKAPMDLDGLAGKHVLKALGKSKQIAGSPLWPAGLQAQAEKDEDEDRARRNVLARVYGSRAMKGAVEKVVGDVRRIMGLGSDGELKGGPSAAGVTEADEDQDDGEELEDDSEDQKSDQDVVMLDSDEAIALAANSHGEESGSAEYESWYGFSTSDDDKGTDADTEDSEGDDDDDDDDPWDHLDNDDVFAEFGDRLVASSTDDSENDDVRPQDNELNRTDDEWSGSENEVEPRSSGSDTETPNSQPPKPILKKAKTTSPLPTSKKTKAKSATPATTATSRFLPTLMAGYVSGSSSDPDADYYKANNKKKGPPENAERKNRMGQQARRALWEKKFGKNANHVKKEAPKGRGANAIRVEDPRQGGRANGASGRGGRGDSSGGMGRGKPKVEEGPLHPSWEAARKAKEKQAKLAGAIKNPIGKKITFD